MSKLEGIKKGDRVRVSFEGEVGHISESGVNVTGKGLYYNSDIKEVGIDVPHFEEANFTIQVVEPPLKVGDCVVPSLPSHCYGRIEGISGAKAWVHWDHNNTDAVLPLTGILRVKP